MSGQPHDMLDIDGVLYRREDAERLGLLKQDETKAEPKARTASNKARTTTSTKES